jgi:hypothetical protein
MSNIYILAAALLVAGWAAALFASRRMLKRRCAELREEFQRQIDSLSASVRALERTSATETTGAEAADSLLSAIPKPAKIHPFTPQRMRSDADQTQTIRTAGGEEITPDILRTIAETVTALVGRKVRILSVRILQTPASVVNSWAEQGRIVVQASHNLAQRGRE